MARYIYNEQTTIRTENLSLSIDANTGLLSSTYSASMSSLSQNVGSYSSATTLDTTDYYVLINQAVTVTLPSSPVSGTLITLRNTTTGNPTISAGTNTIRNVGSASGTSSIVMVNNGAYMLAFHNNVWYGI